MDPLRKLRQDCSVPRIFEGIGKRTLKPDELLEHLYKNTEIEAKSQLRSIASSLNGIAAMHIITENQAEASKLYKSVLKWAKDYNEKIT